MGYLLGAQRHGGVSRLRTKFAERQSRAVHSATAIRVWWAQTITHPALCMHEHDVYICTSVISVTCRACRACALHTCMHTRVCIQLCKSSAVKALSSQCSILHRFNDFMYMQKFSTTSSTWIMTSLIRLPESVFAGFYINKYFVINKHLWMQ